MSRKVLIFTYYFPPAGGVAVQRFLKFTKYLPEFGWEPIVITVKNGSYPYEDESLLKEISPSLRVYRTKTMEPFEYYNMLRGKKGKSLPLVSVGATKKKSFFEKITEYIRANYFIPDARKGWVPYAVEQAEEILKGEKIDAIITTGPPHSTHLIGLKLKEKHSFLWVADFRDPWTGIFYNAMLPRTESTKARDRALETEVLQKADCVTVIGPGMQKQFEDRTKKIRVIYNGYDEEDLALPTNGTDISSASNEFVIRYVGNLLSSQDVSALWLALAEFATGNAKFRIEFVGRVDKQVQESLNKARLNSYITYKDFVGHKQAVELMQEASLLLLLIPDVQDKELIMTGKLYEYLASRSEIISVGPPTGDAAEVLKTVRRKPMLDYTDKDAILAQLNTAYKYWEENHKAWKYTDDAHRIFSRKYQTGLLSELL